MSGPRHPSECCDGRLWSEENNLSHLYPQHRPTLGLGSRLLPRQKPGKKVLPKWLDPLGFFGHREAPNLHRRGGGLWLLSRHRATLDRHSHELNSALAHLPCTLAPTASSNVAMKLQSVLGAVIMSKGQGRNSTPGSASRARLGCDRPNSVSRVGSLPGPMRQCESYSWDKTRPLPLPAALWTQIEGFGGGTHVGSWQLSSLEPNHLVSFPLNLG